MPSAQISDFTARPDLLQTEDPGPRNVGILFGLDHNDEAGVYRDCNDREDCLGRAAATKTTSQAVVETLVQLHSSVLYFKN